MTFPMAHVGPGTELRPLAGKRLVLTRPLAQAADFEVRVRALGGEPAVAPAIAIAPPETWTLTDAALRRIETYEWIVLTSANAVRAMLERADAIGIARELIGRRRLAVVGPATAAVVSASLRPPDLVPSVSADEALGRELVAVDGARVLLPRGDLAGDTLPTMLRGWGAFVDEMVVYRTIPGEGLATIAAGVRAGAIDALLFASASAVRFAADAIGEAGGDSTAWPVAVCLGPPTAKAASAAGFTHVAVADGVTQEELVDRTARWFAPSGQRVGGLP